MGKARVCFVLLVVALCISSAEASAQIVTGNADGTWEAELTSSEELTAVARTVSSRVTTEYTDSSFSRNLIEPVELSDAAKSVPLRVIVEYGDSFFSQNLREPVELEEAAKTATPRVIAEYANSFFSQNLQKPAGLESLAKTVSSRVTVEGADSALCFNMGYPFKPIQPIGIEGDVNKDGVVDVADLIIIGLHFGENPLIDPRADINGDGRTDILDLVVVVKHFGEQAAAAPAKDIWNIDPSQLSVFQEIRRTISRMSSSGPNCVLVLELLDRLIASAVEEPMLLQNYPNPSNPDTWIPYQLAEDVDVTIRIYNVSSKLVRILDLGYKAAGFYTSKEKAAYWDGKNEAGEHVASGVYFYTIQAGEFTATRKLIVLR